MIQSNHGLWLLYKNLFLFAYGLAHHNFYVMSLAIAECRKDVAFDCSTVNSYALDAFAYMIRVRYLNVVGGTTEFSLGC